MVRKLNDIIQFMFDDLEELRVSKVMNAKEFIADLAISRTAYYKMKKEERILPEIRHKLFPYVLGALSIRANEHNPKKK